MREVRVSVEGGDVPDTVDITFHDLPLDNIEECFAEFGSGEGLKRFAAGVNQALSADNDGEGRF